MAASMLSYWSNGRYLKSAEWREHSQIVMTKIRDVQLALARAESAQRGFVLSRQPGYWDQYNAVKESVDGQVASLLAMVADNPEQSRQLLAVRELVKEKLDLLELAGQYVLKNNEAGLKQMVQTGRGHAVMDRIDAGFKQIGDLEARLLAERDIKEDSAFSVAAMIEVFGLLAAFLLLLSVTVLLQREIATRIEVEKALLKAKAAANEASELKSSFLANMSHEIRTPLNGILGMSRLLENSPLSADQREYLDTMKVSSHSLMALINQILDFSRIESGKLQLEEAPFELASLVKSAISVVEYSATSKGLSLSAHLNDDVPTFFLGDALRLRQVLLNLLNNAIKFSEKGTVAVAVLLVKAGESRATLRFEITDEGVGLTDESKGRLFQVFSQGDQSTSRRYGGSGLGLAISKQIVEMMEGRIGVESVENAGSKFYFEVTLKISKFKGLVKPEDTARMIPRSLGAHVLVAEDNRVNQKVVTEMMRLLNCSVEIVDNGSKALETLSAGSFDMVLMDGQMPEMDGYEATRRIRQGAAGEKNRGIPIIATTANAIKGDIEKCLQAGMNDYIGKPISYDDLAYKVEKWLGRGKNAIDVEQFRKMVDVTVFTNPGFIKKLLLLFETDAGAALEKMKTLLSAGDGVGISRSAHTLKSSSASLGAMRLRELFERIEKSTKAGDFNPQHISMLIDAAEKEFIQAVIELKRNNP